jgi:hypothetical protein
LPTPDNAPAPIKKEAKPKPVAVHLEIDQLFSEIKTAKLDHQAMRKLESILIEKGLVSLVVFKDSLFIYFTISENDKYILKIFLR